MHVWARRGFSPCPRAPFALVSSRTPNSAASLRVAAHARGKSLTVASIQSVVLIISLPRALASRSSIGADLEMQFLRAPEVPKSTGRSKSRGRPKRTGRHNSTDGGPRSLGGSRRGLWLVEKPTHAPSATNNRPQCAAQRTETHLETALTSANTILNSAMSNLWHATPKVSWKTSGIESTMSSCSVCS